MSSLALSEAYVVSHLSPQLRISGVTVPDPGLCLHLWLVESLVVESVDAGADCTTSLYMRDLSLHASWYAQQVSP